MHRVITSRTRALCSKISNEFATSCKTKDEATKKNKYSETVLLPQTPFPIRLGGTKRVEMDEYLTKECGFDSLYQWQRENLLGPDFILHDGPPYANGDPHMGHAINKILKDITLRNKVIRGRRVHYVPGWDCHGLPIELKVYSGFDKVDPLKIRHKARNYADKAIEKQRQAFQSWGVMGDWQASGCYFTNKSSYIKNQLRQFIKLYESGLVFRDFKPVYWSPSSRTALAESELEYDKNHKSKCSTVRLRVNNLSPKLKPFENRVVYALTWTTMPWTLVANRALAFAKDVRYCLAEDGEGNLNIVGESLVKSVEAKIGSLRIVTNFQGDELAGSTYLHPFTSESLPFVAGSHVTTDLGTGLVHIAPAHGPEDFLVALENNLKVVSVVDVEGRYTELAGPSLRGLEVLTEGTDEVLKCIAKDVLHVESLTHSYPNDWRTKKPVVIRASDQWFIDIKAIKEKAIASIADVKIYPEKNRSQFVNGLLAQINQRPYWCISRQRVWGTPIPVLCSRKTGKATTSRELVERLCSSIDQHGPDCWWKFPAEKLIGRDVIEKLNIEVDDAEKGKDITDIWFDSGISWSAVLPQGRADLYLEGIDQFTGWFQSSLLTSIALQGCPPYRSLFVHGFAVDENASKMSKSIGNVVNPEDILKGGSNLKKNPAYGIDTLRWWVASHGCQHSQVPVTKEIIDQCAQSVQRLRSILRFLLGVLHPYSSSTTVEPRHRTIDKYMLYKLYCYNKQMMEHYDNYEYHHACKTVLHFVANDVSGLYCQLIKDRLYCDTATSPHRLAAVQVVSELVTVFARTIAPILPHLAEEAWLHHPGNIGSIPLYRTEYKVPEAWNESEIVDCMNVVHRIRGILHKMVATNTWELSVTVNATKDDFALLTILHDEKEPLNSELCEILQVSSITLVESETLPETRLEVSNIVRDLCKRCRRFPEEEENGLCARCVETIAEMKRTSSSS